MDCLARIKDLLEERHWTMYQLAQKAEIPQSTLTNLFARNNAPTIPTLEKICFAFGITLSEFFNDKSQIDEQEQIVLSRWRSLSPESKSTLTEFLKTIYK